MVYLLRSMRTFISLLLAVSTFASLLQEVEEDFRSILPSNGNLTVSATQLSDQELVPEEVFFLFSLRRYDFLDLVFPLAPLLSRSPSVHFVRFLANESEAFYFRLGFSFLDLPPPNFS